MAGFLDFLSDPRFLGQIASSIQAGGQIATGMSQIETGGDQRALAEFQAQQLRQQSGDAMASAQRKAWSDDRAARYVASNTLAAAASSGGGASDPTVLNIIAGQAAEGAYRKAVDLYEGESKARLLSLQAEAKDYEGKAAEANAKRTGYGSMIGAGTTLLKGLARDSSLLQRFGGGGPKLNSTEDAL